MWSKGVSPANNGIKCKTIEALIAIIDLEFPGLGHYLGKAA
jgi:hypothetical protein